MKAFRGARFERLGPRGELLLVLGLALLLLGVDLLRTDLLTAGHRNFPKQWDHQAYIAMARDPFDYRLAPYCWRILMPLIAAALPFALPWSFLLLTYASLALTAVLLYALARALGFGRTLALGGVLLFVSAGWPTSGALYDFWLPDAPGYALIVGAMLCAVTRRDAAFAVTLAVGVAFKEGVLFAAPMYYTLNARRLVEPRLAVRTALLALPALGVLGALRLGLPAENSYDYAERLRRIGLARFEDGGVRDYRQWLRSSSVLLTFLPLFALRRNALLLVRLSPLVVLTLSQLLFARDTERLLALAFPALVLLSLNGWDAVARRLEVSPAALLGLPLLLYAANLTSAAHRPANVQSQLQFSVLYLAALFNLARRPSFLRSRADTARIGRGADAEPMGVTQPAFVRQGADGGNARR